MKISQEQIDFIATEITERLNVKLLVKAMTMEDELGSVLRIHIISEQFLNLFIETHTSGNLKGLVSMPREYGMKLSLCAAFGLDLVFVKILHQLNLMRNKLAHKTDDLNDGDVKQYVRLVKDIPNSGQDFSSLKVPVAHDGKIIEVALGELDMRGDFIVASVYFISHLSSWAILDALK